VRIGAVKPAFLLQRTARILPKKNPIILMMGVLWIRSLAVSYSRMGRCHTTIGAGAFHVRVRDGNGWDHTAMAAKENGWVVIAFLLPESH
jgi:hypothetical protein